MLFQGCGGSGLTYLDHEATGCPCAFGDVNGVIVGGVGDDGEDLAREVGGSAVGVFGFLGFAGGFGERVTAFGQIVDKRAD